MIRNHSRHGSRFPITLGGGGGYSVAKSLRFRSSASAYLSRTPAVAGNQSTWTWSGWVKRGALADGTLFSAGVSSQPYALIGFSSNQLTFDCINPGPTVVGRKYTNALYRDPAAWYHIVAIWDTTNGTAGNRMLLYVNGQQVTSFSLSTDPASSATTQVNSTVAHQLGQFLSAGSLFDGELAEVNFVDGQALAPTAFGAFSTYNQWLPKKYAGTYGTNGFYLPFSGGTATSYAGSFNGSSQYLTVAKNTLFEPTASQAWTVEAWINPTSNPAGDAMIYFYGSPAVATGNDLGIYFALGTGGLYLVGGFYNGTNAYAVNTSIAIPINTWTHVALVSTGSVVTVYANGISGGTVSSSLAPNAPASALAKIGYYETATPRYFPGQISNLRFVKGTAVYTANFVPPTAPLTAITNTSLLTLQSATVVDNSGNSLAITNNGTVVTSVQSPFLNPKVLVADSSGNGNNWTPNNISLTAGSTYDSLTDVPTLTSTTVANYAVLNPLSTNQFGGSATLTNGNLTVAVASSSANVSFATMPCSGKNYIETIGGTFGSGVIAVQCFGLSGLQGAGYYSNGSLYVNNSFIGTYATFIATDVIACDVDTSTRQIRFYKNNAQIGSTGTATGTDALYFAVSGSGSGTGSPSTNMNFGQQPFTYTPPTGFLPLNTFNI